MGSAKCAQLWIIKYVHKVEVVIRSFCWFFLLLVGYIKNTFAASTIGLTYLGCEPFFWSGFIDDVSAVM